VESVPLYLRSRRVNQGRVSRGAYCTKGLWLAGLDVGGTIDFEDVVLSSVRESGLLVRSLYREYRVLVLLMVSIFRQR
jgi:hypothetical protein